MDILEDTRISSVLWVRHGENPANVTPRLSLRVLDLGLTPRGRRQADDAATALATVLPRRPTVFSSPLRRARETAEIIADRLDGSVTVVDPLHELDIGLLDGRGDRRAWAEHDAVVAAWAAGDRAATFPCGEDNHAVVARLSAGLDAVLAAGRAEEPTAVVAHSGVLRTALPVLDPRCRSMPPRMANGSITHLRVRRSRSVEAGIALSVVDWAAVPGSGTLSADGVDRLDSGPARGRES